MGHLNQLIKLLYLDFSVIVKNFALLRWLVFRFVFMTLRVMQSALLIHSETNSLI